ncbi:hypothetical protein Sjap_009362 [Stephania japonica]|uniref:FAR1 domain-containing protein n=1 Tax=Stephania japonica TaxID=461633 RepID=A0AAP0JSR7_9MAGN
MPFLYFNSTAQTHQSNSTKKERSKSKYLSRARSSLLQLGLLRSDFNCDLWRQNLGLRKLRFWKELELLVKEQERVNLKRFDTCNLSRSIMPDGSMEGYNNPRSSLLIIRKVKRSETRKPRAVTREGCHAMIMVRKEKSGRWVVTNLETEHSHPLGLPVVGKARWGSAAQFRLGRRLSDKDAIYAALRFTCAVKDVAYFLSCCILLFKDEKDKKIRELSFELHRTNQRSAECREQLNTILRDAEQHANNLTKTVQDIIVDNVKEIEAEGDH